MCRPPDLVPATVKGQASQGGAVASSWSYFSPQANADAGPTTQQETSTFVLPRSAGSRFPSRPMSVASQPIHPMMHQLVAGSRNPYNGLAMKGPSAAMLLTANNSMVGSGSSPYQQQYLGMAHGFPYGIPSGMTTPQGMTMVGSEAELLMMESAEGSMFHSDMEDTDEKKVKRMMSNRASAKRSRQRRQERLQELELLSAKLRVENASATRRLSEALSQVKRFREENERLSKEVQKVKEMLQGEQGGERKKMKVEVAVAKAEEKEGVEKGGEGFGESLGGGGGDSPSGTASGNPSSMDVHSDPGASGSSEDPTSFQAPVVAAAAAAALSPGLCKAGEESPLSFSGTEGGSSGSPSTTTAIEVVEDLIDNEFFASLIDCFDPSPVLAAP